MSELLNLKRELLALREAGRKFLSIEKLVRYCDIEDEHSSREDSSRAADAAYKHEMELWRASNVSNLEGTRAVNEAAFNALKTLMLVSGGSAAALLAFLGSTWPTASTDAKQFLIAGLMFFAGSLMGSALAYGLTYLCLVSFNDYNKDWLGNTFRVAIVLLVICCYGSLAVGLIQCFHGLNR